MPNGGSETTANRPESPERAIRPSVPLKDTSDIMSVSVDDVAVGERTGLLCDQIKAVQNQTADKLVRVLMPRAEAKPPPSVDHSDLIASLKAILDTATDMRDRIDI